MGLRDRKKSIQSNSVDSEGSWAISYGDMVTLLLAFFVLFFSIDQQEISAKKLAQSLITNIETLGSNSEDGKKESPIQAGEDQKEQGVDDKILENWGAEVSQIGDRIVVDFPGVVFFKVGETKPTGSAKEVLQKFVNKYLPYAGKYRLGVKAYTDNRTVLQKPGRAFKDNLELSALRAVATMRILQVSGIPLNRMGLAGYGVLNLKPEYIEKLPEKYQNMDSRDLARKVLLIIEPETGGA